MNRTPALLYGLGFLVGISLGLTYSPLFVLTLVPLLTSWRNLLSLLIPALIGALYAHQMVEAPAVGREGAVGKAHLSVEQISKSRRGRGWSYRGHLKHFEGVSAKNLPICWSTPTRLVGESDYEVEGTLTQKGRSYFFKPTKGVTWEPIPGTSSLAEKRFQAKSQVTHYLRCHLSSEAAALLSALITGELVDTTLLFDFSRLGLAHLMAISGFHFSLIAALLGLLLRPFFPHKLHALISILLLSLYFGFIGCNPSVVRAWVMAWVGLSALLFERRSSGLNALGVALMVTLIIDPYALFSIGFQFSFLCTGSILIFYRPIERLLRRLLPSFSLGKVWGMGILDQHGFVLATLIRKGVALGVAVNIGALPLTLFLFHRFPWMGLVYNLFFPLLITLALFFLPLAALVDLLIPWGGRFLFSFEDWLVQISLDFTRYLPAYFDFQWVTASLSLPFMLGLFTCLLFLATRLLNQKVAYR